METSNVNYRKYKKQIMVREKYEKEKDDCLRIRGRVDRKIVGAIEPGRMADSDDRSCRDVMGGAGSVLGHYDTGRRVGRFALGSYSPPK